MEKLFRKFLRYCSSNANFRIEPVPPLTCAVRDMLLQTLPTDDTDGDGPRRGASIPAAQSRPLTFGYVSILQHGGPWGVRWGDMWKCRVTMRQGQQRAPLRGALLLLLILWARSCILLDAQNAEGNLLITFYKFWCRRGDPRAFVLQTSTPLTCIKYNRFYVLAYRVFSESCSIIYLIS